MEPVVGIDLGTTNSEIAFIIDDNVEILTQNDNGVVPSCVGIDSNGELIVGIEAKNQAAVSPNKTISSIKRHMGEDIQVKLGDKEFSPQEISAFILKDLKKRAESIIGKSVNKAVVTVPAYFTDSQRKATREAGSIAGLEVVRIINEPTAAALAYEKNIDESKTILVYDLGGGTFDVSIVNIDNSVVEVLSSTGNNKLGGDDFDKKLAELFAHEIEKEHSVDVRVDSIAMARLIIEAEKAKRSLSIQPFAQVEIDHIATKKERPVHFSYSLSRDDFNELIYAEIDKTMDSVNKALEDAKLQSASLDQVILVGGSTRMPVVAETLMNKLNIEPHGEVDPDLCVGIGAGIQAAREMGIETSTVLIDITPYTFGTAVFGTLDGMPSDNLFVPIIRKNTKLPASKTEIFYTMSDCQSGVEVKIYQGENKNSAFNLLIGEYFFKLSGRSPANSAVTMKYNLDINGILQVEAVEKTSGKKLEVTIENAFSNSSVQKVDESKDKINQLWNDDSGNHKNTNEGENKLPQTITDILELATSKLDIASSEDKNEIINLIEDIKISADENNFVKAEELSEELDEILFYVD